MMNNLFSIFDPSTSIFSASWLMIIFFPLLASPSLWMNTSTLKKAKKNILYTFEKEISFTLGNTEPSVKMMIILAFFSILLMNVTALYPQVFSLTSHLTITLPLSLIFWLSIFSFAWSKNTKHTLAHLVPEGTPTPLMMFMVLIEMTSNLIRPLTLCVRLTANLIAGHLLMSLLGNAILSISFFSVFPAMTAMITLTILETAVAFIQAYVFMTLITLYTTEIK